MTPSDFDTIAAYHQTTKHHFHRYARSAGYMDWANQPDPFRRFDGVPRISLPLSATSVDLSFIDLFSHAPDAVPSALTQKSLAVFLQNALGLSAWKAAGASRWSLRINPSSGNLHPTESHLILPSIPGLEGGVYHYAPHRHGLEQRTQLSNDQWEPLEAHFDGAGFLLALTTIFWREAWKYGERAYRYCNLDIGHALSAVAFAARLHHWRPTILTGVGDDQVGGLLGFDRTPWHALEAEIPEVLCWISVQPNPAPVPQTLPDACLAPFNSLAFSGRPRPLSRQPVAWPVIEQAAAASVKPSIAPSAVSAGGHQRPRPPESWNAFTAQGIIHQRRSAVSFDPHKSTISAAHFRSMLDMTLPRSDIAPFSLALASPAVDLLLFVHQVEDLAPGLYLLSRVPGQQPALQAAWRSDFEWQHAWPDFPLYRLQQADLTFEAMEASCHQEIAGNSAFAVAMLAGFEPLIKLAPYRYRHLHWECGMIGQVLYLTAEACGMRGTGIGCFFDDAVHQMLGIEDKAHQSLYHFTVGHPIEDRRLATLPAYDHLNR